jgi:hypothetical protein
MADQQPYFTYNRAYLAVASDSKVVGVVRKEGNAWTALRFGVPDDQQPTRRFVTRQEAAEHLLALKS